jgi:hypothetical protein
MTTPDTGITVGSADVMMGLDRLEASPISAAVWLGRRDAGR